MSAHHKETFVTKYIFSQDHKMISKQYLITGIEDQLTDQGLRFYPNPVNDILYLDNAVGVSKIEIFNMSGLLIMQIQHPDDQMEIDVSGLCKGMYIICCQKASGVQILKLVK